MPEELYRQPDPIRDLIDDNIEVNIHISVSVDDEEILEDNIDIENESTLRFIPCTLFFN